MPRCLVKTGVGGGEDAGGGAVAACGAGGAAAVVVLVAAWAAAGGELRRRASAAAKERALTSSSSMSDQRAEDTGRWRERDGELVVSMGSPVRVGVRVLAGWGTWRALLCGGVVCLCSRQWN